jgi:hypothetical protein
MLFMQMPRRKILMRERRFRFRAKPRGLSVAVAGALVASALSLAGCSTSALPDDGESSPIVERNAEIFFWDSMDLIVSNNLPVDITVMPAEPRGKWRVTPKPLGYLAASGRTIGLKLMPEEQFVNESYTWESNEAYPGPRFNLVVRAEKLPETAVLGMRMRITSYTTEWATAKSQTVRSGVDWQFGSVGSYACGGASQTKLEYTDPSSQRRETANISIDCTNYPELGDYLNYRKPATISIDPATQ